MFCLLKRGLILISCIRVLVVLCQLSPALKHKFSSFATARTRPLDFLSSSFFCHPATLSQALEPKPPPYTPSAARCLPTDRSTTTIVTHPSSEGTAARVFERVALALSSAWSPSPTAKNSHGPLDFPRARQYACARNTRRRPHLPRAGPRSPCPVHMRKEHHQRPLRDSPVERMRTDHISPAESPLGEGCDLRRRIRPAATRAPPLHMRSPGSEAISGRWRGCCSFSARGKPSWYVRAAVSSAARSDLGWGSLGVLLCCPFRPAPPVSLVPGWALPPPGVGLEPGRACGRSACATGDRAGPCSGMAPGTVRAFASGSLRPQELAASTRHLFFRQPAGSTPGQDQC